MEAVHRQTPPVLHSRLIATIDKRDIFPENLAFDPTRNSFFLGSTARNAILRCSIAGACVSLVAAPAGEQAYILGLKIDRRLDAIWATTNTLSGASLRRYNIKTGSLEQTARLEGKHVFNDLALSTTGVVYVTDTSEGSIYKLNTQSNTLTRVAPEHTFTAANGIAISPDERMIYVSAWGDGIDMIDLRSGSVKPVIHPDQVSLAFIDGLYAIKGSLIAIQNGPMLPRIVQFSLNTSGREIVEMTTLERRNPSFDGLTTGALVGNQLYYVANPQIDKKNAAQLDPLQILAVRVSN
jgi:streptogramin lyase